MALRDLAVHAAHAACVDGRGDVYQWGDGFFAGEQSASGDGKPVLTLRGKVRTTTLPPFEKKKLIYRARVGHHQGTGRRVPRIRAVGFR